MNKFLNRERIIALVCLAFAAFIWFTAGTFPASFLDAVGPALYPRFLAALIAALSLALFITSRGPVEPMKGKMEFKSFAYVLVVICIYLLIFNLAGFVISTIAFLLALVLYFDNRELKLRLKYGVPYAVIFSLLLYFFFARFLGVLLPSIIL